MLQMLVNFLSAHKSTVAADMNEERIKGRVEVIQASVIKVCCSRGTPK